jgi:hypothetical protein
LSRDLVLVKVARYNISHKLLEAISNLLSTSELTASTRAFSRLKKALAIWSRISRFMPECFVLEDIGVKGDNKSIKDNKNEKKKDCMWVNKVKILLPGTRIFINTA